MKKTLLTLALAASTLFAGAAHAAAGDCAAKAADKKLAGAAKTSFMKKCEKDAGAASASASASATAPVTGSACEKSAAAKKLAGAAKTSFLKKCSRDEAAAAKK